MRSERWGFPTTEHRSPSKGGRYARRLRRGLARAGGRTAPGAQTQRRGMLAPGRFRPPGRKVFMQRTARIRPRAAHAGVKHSPHGTRRISPFPAVPEGRSAPPEALIFPQEFFHARKRQGIQGSDAVRIRERISPRTSLRWRKRAFCSGPERTVSAAAETSPGANSAALPEPAPPRSRYARSGLLNAVGSRGGPFTTRLRKNHVSGASSTAGPIDYAGMLQRRQSW